MSYIDARQVYASLVRQTAYTLLEFERGPKTHAGTERDACEIERILWTFFLVTREWIQAPRFYVPVARRGISDEVRDRVFARDGNRCLKCGRGDGLVIDHVVALAVGGGHDEANFQTLCTPCNLAKGTFSVDYRVPSVEDSHE